jgi:hypothetical protein
MFDAGANAAWVFGLYAQALAFGLQAPLGLTMTARRTLNIGD